MELLRRYRNWARENCAYTTYVRELSEICFFFFCWITHRSAYRVAHKYWSKFQLYKNDKNRINLVKLRTLFVMHSDLWWSLRTESVALQKQRYPWEATPGVIRASRRNGSLCTRLAMRSRYLHTVRFTRGNIKYTIGLPRIPEVSLRAFKRWVIVYVMAHYFLIRVAGSKDTKDVLHTSRHVALSNF